MRMGVASVHPHACGEYELEDAAEMAAERFTPTPVGNMSGCLAVSNELSGSPPRLWGIFCGAGGDRLLCRFTPTPVGNITSGRRRIRVVAVHPHACGEYTPSAMQPPA